MKLTETFCFFSTRHALRRNFNQYLTCRNTSDTKQSGGTMIRSIQTRSRPQKKKYVTLGPSAHTAVNKGGDRATFIRFTVQKHSLKIKTKNLILLLETISLVTQPVPHREGVLCPEQYRAKILPRLVYCSPSQPPCNSCHSTA